MLWRLGIVAIVGGILLGFVGCREHKLSQGASQTAVAVELAKLEAGDPPADRHVQLDRHTALYYPMVYSVQLDQARDEPIATDSVNFVWYPVISADHDFHALVAAAAAKYGDIKEAPDEVQAEVLGNVDFVMLVKSERWKLYADLPDEPWASRDQTRGLIMNEVESLGDEEMNLLRESFPNANFGKMLLLEEGREPMTPITAMGMVGGGVLLVLFGAGMLLSPLLLRGRD